MKQRWSVIEEANALACNAFRNGFLEDLHAGKYSQLLEDNTLARITDAEMKKLMVESSKQFAALLTLKEQDPDKYWQFIKFYNQTYCKDWQK